MRFDLRRGTEGVAFITDSAQKGANGIIVVDLGTGESWRRLNDHLSTKAEDISTFLPIVEGRPFLEPQPDGSVKQGAGSQPSSSLSHPSHNGVPQVQIVQIVQTPKH